MTDDAGKFSRSALSGLAAGAALGAAAVTVVCDVARLADVAGRLDGPVAVWINNAGLARHHWLNDYTEAEIDLMVAQAVVKLIELDDLCVPRRQFLGGLSIGGYGALRLGTRHGTQYAAVSAHSSLTDLADLYPLVAETPEQLEAELVDQPAVLEGSLQARPPLPALRFDCGTEDGRLAGSRAMYAALTRAGVAHTYGKFPGAHTWE